MSHSNSRAKKLITLSVLLLALNSTHSFAACYFNQGNFPNGPTDVLLRGPGVTSMPADLENDSLIYQSSATARPNNNITCEEKNLAGLVPEPHLGAPMVNSYTFPIKDTGVAIEILDTINGTSRPLKLYGEETVGKGNVLGSSTGPFIIRFVKIGKIKHGTTVGPFKIGSYKFGKLITHNFTLSGNLTISAASCKTPDVSVNMGDYVASEITGTLGETNPVNFNIELNECQEGISKVTYSLLANTPVIDPTAGLVSLDGTSTAKGVGLRIMDGNGTPLTLDKFYPVDSYDTNGGNFKIPLSATYVRLQDKELSVGTANTALTFTMNYL